MKRADIPDLRLCETFEIEPLEGQRAGVMYRVDVLAADESIITVSAPLERGFLAPLPVSTRVRGHARIRKFVYRFESRVAVRETDGGRPRVSLALPEWMDRVERAPLHRLEAPVGVMCATIKADRGVPRRFKARCLDVFAGGLRFVTEEEVVPGNVLGLTVSVPPSAVHFEGVVTHSQVNDSAERSLRIVSVEFVRREYEDRRRWESFLHDRDQDLRMRLG